LGRWSAAPDVLIHTVGRQPSGKGPDRRPPAPYNRHPHPWEGGQAMTVTIEPPHHPIIYVRGYAGSEDAVEETVATPYMGFNLGSTKVRQRWDKSVERHTFESPLVRLMKDHGYRDVYEAGEEVYLKASIPPRSVIIYRYYDQVSGELNADPERPSIPTYAEGLSQLIARVRDAVCGDDDTARKAFRVYLVAHSMGGLICRCLLQNPAVDTAGTSGLVDKVFTYATPHNGIDVRLLGNVPGFFSRNNSNNFNRAKMARYLDLTGEPERVDTLNDRFGTERFFSLVGTNHKDYSVAAGWSRRVVGPMSDGLVRIDNAAVRGTPRAYVHRSHSGDYGIVNSEEGFQNLSRFLFGDVRVDGVLKVDELTLPPRVDEAHRKGREIRASYHFEVVVRPRGARYDLHRRLVGEDSAILRTFDEMLKPAPGARARHPHLFSVFLSARNRTKRGAGPLVFSVDLRVRVPEYEVDKKLWMDDHIEGSYLFRDTLTIEAVPPAGDGQHWTMRWGLDSRTPGRATRPAEAVELDARYVTCWPVLGIARSDPSRATHEDAESSHRTPGGCETMDARYESGCPGTRRVVATDVRHGRSHDGTAASTGVESQSLQGLDRAAPGTRAGAARLRHGRCAAAALRPGERRAGRRLHRHRCAPQPRSPVPRRVLGRRLEPVHGQRRPDRGLRVGDGPGRRGPAGRVRPSGDPLRRPVRGHRLGSPGRRAVRLRRAPAPPHRVR
jgi:hypothetical protein